MRKIILIVIVGLNLINVYCQSNNPNFKQIYDFQVGDIFLYKTINTDCVTGIGNCDIKTSYDKFEIINRIINNDSIVYYRKHNDSNSSIDTVVYVDSVNNILDKNNNDLVMFMNYNDSVFLRVRTENDIIPKKIIGGIGFNYKNNNGKCDTTQVLNFNDLITTLIYGQGLGLIEEDKSQFEISSSTLLIGYRKGNDTTGTLTTIRQQNFGSIFQVYPNPFKDQFVIKFSMNEPLDIDIFNQQGVLVKSFIAYKSLNQINSSNLKAGIYLLRLKGKNQYIYKSIIKD